jgi:hypothetical protein
MWREYEVDPMSHIIITTASLGTTLLGRGVLTQSKAISPCLDTYTYSRL